MLHSRTVSFFFRKLLIVVNVCCFSSKMFTFLLVPPRDLIPCYFILTFCRCSAGVLYVRRRRVQRLRIRSTVKRVRDAQCTISSPVVFASLKKIKRRRRAAPEMVRTQSRVLNQKIMSDKMRQLPRKKGGLSPHIRVTVMHGQRAV